MASAPENKIDLRAIKALSKEKRQALALDIRKDQDLWNAVNGMDGLSEHSDKSLLQGTITNNDQIVPRARILVGIKGQVVAETTSNQLGYFSIELKASDYTVVIADGDTHSDEILVKTKVGITSRLDYDFKFDGEVSK